MSSEHMLPSGVGNSSFPRPKHIEEARPYSSWGSKTLPEFVKNTDMPDVERYHLSRLAPDPSTLTPYPDTTHLESIWSGPTLEDVLTYSARSEATNGLFDTPEQATNHLGHLWDDPLKTFPYERLLEIRDAVRRLRELPQLRERNAWGPDIIYKAFHDLDLAVFGGALRGMCRLRWVPEARMSNPGAHTCGTCHQKWITTADVAIPGVDTVEKDVGAWQCTILMNSTGCFLLPIGEDKKGSRWTWMWDTLLHEMVHAYLKLSTKAGVNDGGHGIPFQACLVAVNWRLGEEGLKLGIQSQFHEEWVEEGEGIYEGGKK